jgi:hypothetical protein
MNSFNSPSIAEQVVKQIIPHTAYAKVVNGCTNIIDMGIRTRRANSGMVIMGHGGTGKTTAIEDIQSYVIQKYSGKFSTPVLLTKISSDTTIKSFYMNILSELSHPIITAGVNKNITADKLQHLVVNALKGHVCTLFIDEVSDVFSNRHKNQFSLDFLVMIKHLLSDTSVNIILVGTPALKQLFHIADDQFRTRFPTIFSLPVFAKDEEWVRLLNGYVAKSIGLMDLSVLPPLYDQLHDWTKGNLRDLSSLLVTAIDLAEQEKVEALTFEHLVIAREGIFPFACAA